MGASVAPVWVPVHYRMAARLSAKGEGGTGGASNLWRSDNFPVWAAFPRWRQPGGDVFRT
jgi:hypothetical protein